MRIAPKPDNEAERLALLRKLQVLDTPIDERFERITRIVCRSLNVPIAAISLVDDDRQWFKSVQGLGVAETPRDVAFCSHTILEEGPFIVADAASDERFSDNPLVTDDPRIRFYAGYPITMGDGMRIGTLCAIDDKPRRVSEEDTNTLRDLTAMVRSELESESLSMAHQELLHELAQAERAAVIDPLTRLWNRAGAENLLFREWEKAARGGTPLSLAMVDIDSFKAINDTYGHQAGDEALKHFSRVMLGVLRPYDTVSRWGGEEFMVILPGCDREALNEALSRTIQAIRDQPVVLEDESVRLTASIGGVCISKSGKGAPADYIELADKAMYKAKGTGRDRFCIAADRFE